MKLNVAKELFHASAFEYARIVETPMGKGWNLYLCNDSEVRILSNDKGSERIFKTIEAAFKVAKDIGFQNAILGA